MLALEAMREIAKEEKHLQNWKKALYEMRWDGRMEEVLPGVVVDGAHNPGAVKAFLETVETEENAEKIVLFSAVKEKEYETMIQMICNSMKVKKYILTEVGEERGVSVHKLGTIFRKYTDCSLIEEADTQEAFHIALSEKGESDRVYCLGSLYLVGKIKDLIAEERIMLNFEEELKKFKPSLEVEDIEEAVYQEDMTDMTDILREMMKQNK